MRRLLLMLTILFSAYVSAEDIIVTRSSQRISAIIEEVGPDYIKYHSSSNPDGPLFRLEAYEIATVIYGNGDVQTFDAVAPAAAEEEQQLPQPQPGVQPAYGQQPFGYQPYPQQPFVDYKALERMRKDSIRTAKKEEKKAAYKARLAAIPKEHFLLANYAYAANNSHNVGLTYGWCHVGGVYVNAMLSVSGFHYHNDYYCYDDLGYYNDFKELTDRYQLTNERTKQRLSLTVGFMARLGCPLYLNGGVGYSYQSMSYKSTKGQWIAMELPKTIYHGLSYQLGLIGQIKNVSLMANCSVFGFVIPEALVGVGVAIPSKKGVKK